jgi:tryptophan synthase alpha chain
VSSLGVTGVRSNFHAGVEEFLSDVRAAAEVPIAVGFGISSREQVERFSKQSDGVIVGSAIVRKIEEVLPRLRNEAEQAAALDEIGQFVADLKIR